MDLNNDLDTTGNNAVVQNATKSRCRDDSEPWAAIQNYNLIIMSSTLILVGTAGNIATYNVFKQRAYKNNIMANMFRYLSMLDMIVLWTNVSRFWIRGVFDYHISTISLSVCLFMVFWVRVTLSLGNWMLVVITVARLVHLKYPLHTGVICSKMNYKLLQIGTHVFVITFYGGIMLSIRSHLSAKDYASHKSCYYHLVNPEIQTPFQKVLYMFDSFLGPASMLVICNGLLILELNALRARRDKMFNHGPSSSMGSTLPSGDDDDEQDRTQNAVGLEGPLEVPASSNKSQVGYGGKIHETLYHGKQAMKKYQTSGLGKDMSTSRPSGESMDQQRWRSFVEDETFRRRGRNMTIRSEMFRHPAPTGNRLKERILKDGPPAKRNPLRALDETDVSQKVVQNTVFSHVEAANDNVRRNFNCNTNNPDPEVVASASFREPEDTNQTTNNKDNLQKVTCSKERFTTTDLLLEQGSGVDLPTKGVVQEQCTAPQTVAGEATSQAPVKYAASNDIRFSVPSGSSDARGSGESTPVQRGKATYSKWNSRTNTLTRMIIIANFAFILFNLPFWIFHLFVSKGFTNNPSAGCNLKVMISDVILLLRFSNNSVNFIFYCALGSRFRQEFITWFRKLFR